LLDSGGWTTRKNAEAFGKKKSLLFIAREMIAILPA
jgi:hypothetical protein